MQWQRWIDDITQFQQSVARVGGGRARTVGGCKLLRDEIPPQVNVVCLVSRKHLAVVDRQPSGKKRAAGWRAVPVDVVVG